MHGAASRTGRFQQRTDAHATAVNTALATLIAPALVMVAVMIMIAARRARGGPPQPSGCCMKPSPRRTACRVVTAMRTAWQAATLCMVVMTISIVALLPSLLAVRRASDNQALQAGNGALQLRRPPPAHSDFSKCSGQASIGRLPCSSGRRRSSRSRGRRCNGGRLSSSFCWRGRQPRRRPSASA